MRKKQTFKNSYLGISSITELECLDALSYEELFHLIVLFQNQKRKNFGLYLKYVDSQAQKGLVTFLTSIFEQERNSLWNKHLHYEKLIQWCFEETTKRTKKRIKDKYK